MQSSSYLTLAVLQYIPEQGANTASECPDGEADHLPTVSGFASSDATAGRLHFAMILWCTTTTHQQETK